MISDRSEKPSGRSETRPGREEPSGSEKPDKKTARKQASHRRILEAAAQRLREHGIVGTRIADVMGDAGLTVGGFYAHWASKEALVTDTLRAAVRAAHDGLLEGLDRVAPSHRVETIVRRYLSADHRDDRTRGCPLPAVAGEIGTVERAYADALAAEIDRSARGLASMMEKGGRGRRERALGLLALMVGGLTLARAVEGTPLSDEILAAARALARDAIE